MKTALCLAVTAVVAVSGNVRAATITITPADDYKPMEAAKAGDVVEVAPGTYKFRLNFTQGGTSDNPIIIRAQDPNNRPVWDLTGTTVSAAPGSYTGGDKGRGCWQFHAGYFEIDGIVFKNCNDPNAAGSSGLRVVNVPGIHVRNSLFQGCSNGMIGAGDDILIEFTEFDHNGTASGAHNLYIFGGTLTVRYCYLHDSPAGQNFHVRSRDATLAYNWFSRAGSYPGDMMTCNYFCGGTGTSPITQKMLLLGNVFVQAAGINPTVMVALYKDEATSYDSTGTAATMDLTMAYNTFIGLARAGQNRVINMRNDTLRTQVHAWNNVATHFSDFTLPYTPGMNTYAVDGSGNWLTTGTTVISVTGTHFGADPQLGPSYVPLAGSPVIGAAVPGAPSLPMYEYYKDETVKLMGRARAATSDIGAFESTSTAPPFGSGGMPGVDGGSGGADGGGGTADDGGGPHGDDGGPDMGSGCGCRITARSQASPWGLVVLLGLLLALRRRRPE